MQVVAALRRVVHNRPVAARLSLYMTALGRTSLAEVLDAPASLRHAQHRYLLLKKKREAGLEPALCAYGHPRGYKPAIMRYGLTPLLVT
jgi:hypothetical protein